MSITPDKPETSDGYIQQSGAAVVHREYTVAQFVENPNLEIAKAYLTDGQYTWNSGMFVLRASKWLKAFKHFRHDISTATQSSWQGDTIDTLFIRPKKEAFIQAPFNSF